MKAILRTPSHLLILLLVSIAVSATLIHYKTARASITVSTFAPTVLGVDDVVGTTNADYSISYTTDSTGTVSEITATFPTGYAILPATQHVFPASIVESCNGTSGYICINDVDQLVALATSSDTSLTIALDASFDYSTNPGDDTVSFTIVTNIKNPETIGIKTGFSVDDDGFFNDPSSPSSDVIIVAGPVDHFVFTQEPDGPATANDPTTSGTAFDTQPIVEARDEFDNVATGFSDSVALVLATGSGLLDGTPGSECYGGPATGSVYITAVDGVADFSSKSVKYYASADHESFSITAQEGCSGSGATEATTAALTSDVVADTLVWTEDPSGCVSNKFCSSRGSIEAQSALSSTGEVVDEDYSEDVTIASNGTGTVFGNLIQSIVAGILNLTNIGYIPTHPSTPETINFTADSGSLAQVLTGDITVGATASGGSGGGGVSSNPEDRPGSCSPSNPEFCPPPPPPTEDTIAVPTPEAPVKVPEIPVSQPNVCSPAHPEFCPPATPIFGNILNIPGIPILGKVLENVSGICSLINLKFCIPKSPENEIVAATPQIPGAPVQGNILSNGESPFYRNLTIGSRGSDVYALQQFLYGGGFLRVAPTGYFGDSTKEAVSAFQRSAVIFPSSGFVGSLTISKINSISGWLPTGALNN